MIQASIYGRLGRDPKATQTKTGKPMTTASIAVDIGKSPEEQETLWVTLMAFERNAEALARHQQGDCIGAMGKLTRGKYTGNDGQERESWSLLVDALHSSRTVRPTPAKRNDQGAAKSDTSTKPKAGRAGTESWAPYQQAGDGAPFDDPIPF